jgi:protein gp37
VSEGCRNCYAERIAGRFSGPGQVYEGFASGGPRDYHGQTGAPRTNGTWRWTGKVELISSKLEEPLRWRKPRRVFVNSMSDLFHEGLSFEDIAAVWNVMAAADEHTFQVLTKRPQRALEFFRWLPSERAWPSLPVAGALQNALEVAWPLPNVWLGVSVEDQATADERLGPLLLTPAAKRFVSYEPALGPVDFADFLWWVDPRPENDAQTRVARHGLDWVIVGGESGPHARPFDVAWARTVVQECRRAGVACFVKQLGSRPVGLREECDRCNWQVPTGRHGLDCPGGRVLVSSKGGEPSEWPEDLRVREFPK